VREKRVTTPDGHIWYVRRRWAKRQLPWKRRADYELGPTERDDVPVLPDADDLLGSWERHVGLDIEHDLYLVLGLAVLGVGAAVAGAVVVVERGVPFLVANIGWIGAALAVIAILVLLDRLTRPWFIEAESARLFRGPRRIWRVHGWWRSRRAVRAVVMAIADGRIDNEHGVGLFTERSTAQ
jgi:hypothetical protein